MSIGLKNSTKDVGAQMNSVRTASTNSQLPLIVITGPTASGKSGLAMELAKKYGGEIICADSRTVYTRMDIGTAKPTRQDRSEVRHHLLDVAEPDQRFTAADFKRMATQSIRQIRERGNIPFLVGGTGLYIDGVILNLAFQEVDAKKRAELDKLAISELQQLYYTQHKKLPHNDKNKRHLISGLLKDDSHTPVKSEIDSNTIVVAIATDRAELQGRIEKRAHEIIEAGVVDEAAKLAKRYGWGSEAMTGNIYPLINDYLRGDCTKQQLIERFIIRDRQLAKRQVTWLRRHDFVTWLTLDEARSYLSTILDRA